MSKNRYLRQTSLADFGPDSQEKLRKAKVLVVGAGGLGIPVLQYLTAMGIGTVGIVENDTIDLTNLQRQVLYSEKDVNRPKIQVASERLNALNSDINIKLHPCFLNSENSLDIISQYDLVVDASDNFPTRYLINDSCVILKKPFVYGALHGFEGQVSVFNYKAGSTYRCLFPNKPSSEEIPNCDVNGVLGIIPSIIGSLQCLETIKIITGIGKVASGELVIYEGLSQEIRKLQFPLNPDNQKITALEQDYGFIDCNPELQISSKEFAKLLNLRPNVKIIDVRSKKEFQSAHIKNSRNIPIEEFTKVKDLPFTTGEKVYIICQSGVRSQKAVKILKNSSESEFINVEGGHNALKNEIIPEQLIRSDDSI